MSEPRRSTRARAREEAAPAPEPEPVKEKAAKRPASSRKRKRVVDISKDSAPATPAREPSQQAPKHLLPIRIVEGLPLPTLPEPQALDLPATEYQDVQQSGVLTRLTSPPPLPQAHQMHEMATDQAPVELPTSPGPRK